MPSRRLPATAILALSLSASAAGLAQDPYKATRDKLIESTVFVAGGTAGATYHTLANDISLVLSDENLRVVAVSTSNAVQNWCT